MLTFACVYYKKGNEVNMNMNKLLGHSIFSNRFKVIASIAIIWIFYGLYPHQGQGALVICTFYVGMYLLMIWIPKRWWTSLKYLFITVILIGTSLVIFFGHISLFNDKLLWPLICLLAIAPTKFILPTLFLAIATIIVIVGFSWTNQFPYETLLALVGIYIGIRGRSLLREAEQVNHEQFLELKKMHEKLKAAHAELQEATLQSMQYAALTERTRIAREIHDGLGHQMTSLIVQLQALELMLPNDPNTAEKTVTELLNIARKGMGEIRMSVREWANDEKGLGIIAIKGFISQVSANSNIHFQLKEEGEFSEWSEDISIAIFRILQESVTNVIRHSEASKVEVYISENERKLSLIVSDNGKLKDKALLQKGFGITGIIERCKSVGGTCTFSINPNGGLKILVRIPL